MALLISDHTTIGLSISDFNTIASATIALTPGGRRTAGVRGRTGGRGRAAGARARAGGRGRAAAAAHHNSPLTQWVNSLYAARRGQSVQLRLVVKGNAWS